ncbi:hypothetical protein TYRP_023666 [Tyrophagus putrescentiae]|nr:hypothetical protein TYRP_023666 [Tyrophagus putrescentiae]
MAAAATTGSRIWAQIWSTGGLMASSRRREPQIALRKLEASSARREHQFGTGHSGRSAAATSSTADHIIPPQHTN